MAAHRRAGEPAGGIKLPDSVSEQYKAHYFDFDLYGTVNFNDYVGAQVGYRSLDVGYLVDRDRGDLKMKGIYFGGVVRYQFPRPNAETPRRSAPLRLCVET